MIERQLSRKLWQSPLEKRTSHWGGREGICRAHIVQGLRNALLTLLPGHEQ